MVKRLVLPLAILLGGIAVIVAIMLTKEEPKANPKQLAEPPKPKVAVQKAITQAATLSAKTQGSVVAKRETDIVAQVSGQIIQVATGFVNGQFIDRGEVLIKIDDRDYRAALVGAQSRLLEVQRQLAEEKGRYRQAKKEWRDLGNQEANDLFLRKPQLAEAEARLASAQADLAIANLNIERTEIRLPFNARIKQTRVNVGQFIGVGTTIASVYDTATAEVRLPLSDRQLALLDLPVSNKAPLSESRVTLTGVIAGESHQWQGKITRTEASVDIRSRMYYAIAEVEQPFSEKHSAPLLPGLFVEAEIEGKHLTDVLVLPKESLVNRTNLYVLDEHNKIRLTPVTVLSKKNGRVWLRSELTQESVILLEKHAVVSPGLEIEPVFLVGATGNKKTSDGDKGNNEQALRAQDVDVNRGG